MPHHIHQKTRRSPQPTSLKTWGLRGVFTLFAALTLSACDNVPNEETVAPDNSNRTIDYTGPACATAEACRFKLEFWDKMPAVSQCDNCHDGSGAAPTDFVHQSDVNIAFAQSATVVNLTDPAASAIIGKINNGHNCGSAGACAALATIVEGYISKWAGGDSNAGASNEVVLEAPTPKDPGSSKSLPASSAGFASAVWPLLTANCGGCHREGAATPQAPFFSEGDVNAAYEAVVTSQKINLDNPAVSRLVVRLRQEFHNCWDPDNTGSSDCAASAQAMEDAIISFADGVSLSSVDGSWVVSKALNLTEGIIASGGTRDDSSTIALYQFKTGSGDIIYDTSGVQPSLNLTLFGTEGIDYKWVGGWGVEFLGGKAQALTADSKKLRDRIVASGAYSIEAWIVPANVAQGDGDNPSRIISYSAGPQERNFTLGQAAYQYVYQNRTSNTDANGKPSRLTDDGDEDLQASQQHVVLTFDPILGRKVYVNGVDVALDDNAGAGSVDSVSPPGSLTDWDDSFAFVFGSEVSGEYPWAGKLRLVAIHNSAMTPAQITQNFDAGVGEKFFLLFGVGDIGGLPAKSFVMFEVSQYDSYSYLFNTPTFVNLDGGFIPAGEIIKGIHIGMNGQEPAVGQAFRNLSTTINTSDYGPGKGVGDVTGQLLTSMGTIIALDKGPDGDEFFLTFEQLGTATNVRIPAVCNPISTCVAAPTDGTPVPDIGLRTFDEINATMAVVTGVDPNDSNIKTVFTTIKQQLPTTEDINTFLSAHEIGVAQLAIEYCSALVDDTTARASFFPGFDFNADANGVSDADWNNQVTGPLLDRVMGTNLASQPDTAAVQAELLTLITDPNDVRLDNSGSIDGMPDGLAKCGGACGAGRTALVVKSVCAAVLGSAVSLVQ
ncbi:MAG: LamG domain-containing protein [Gammaproteobacteria bacterium]|nr:LamG domain-containing protein [Gammaproteobacteria bacterium]